MGQICSTVCFCQVLLEHSQALSFTGGPHVALMPGWQSWEVVAGTGGLTRSKITIYYFAFYGRSLLTLELCQRCPVGLSVMMGMSWICAV